MQVKNVMVMIICVIMMILFSSCATQHQPLVFGTYTSFGIKADIAPRSGEGYFQLGYHDGSLALIPVATGSDEKPVILGSKAIGRDDNNNPATHKDAYSVVVQFDASSGGNPASKGGINLGKTIATGSAAKVIADGIYNKLSNDNSTE